jgi:monofunctional biosynthetic peptidoglycan transglycosylase
MPVFKGIKKRILKIIRFIIFFFFISTIIVTIIYRFVPPPITPLMVIRLQEQLFEGEELKLYKDWERLKQISPHMVQAVVASEDNNFMTHFGVDFDAIKKAQKLNRKGKTLRGASTISQQTAKNVFLWPKRSWVRKGFEVYFTGLIEIFWGKERIMEVYLNVIEMGNGIYGVEAASNYFFNKSAKDLNPSEAALLAAILPNPRVYNAMNPSQYIRKKQQRIMRAMNRIERVSFNN